MLTIEKILKSGHNNTNRNTWNYQEVIKNNKQRIFIYDYPILKEFKEDFETHFCAHFYKREFAFTPGEFCYYLQFLLFFDLHFSDSTEFSVCFVSFYGLVSSYFIIICFILIK